ncbi:MAG TPA: Crp/Fnr family transcriptional regulator [Gemmatimonadaceae bacterium]|nr:Crp/Fnr family transcriptional regulator [Gemmatimonadaceae bacterium]
MQFTLPEQSGATSLLDNPRVSRNRLLSLLPAGELDPLVAASEIVTVKTKDILFRPEDPISHVYFPEDCVISLVVHLEGGGGVEAMTVGNDGFTPLVAFHGVESTGLLGCGQITGATRRISLGDFARLVSDGPELTRVLHRYSQVVFEAVSQSAACNRMHVVEQRCARWLLMSHDRVGKPSFDLTQSFLAQMLGVRRAGVTVAMGILERQGLLSHGRGSVTIVDRAGLEKAACECYRRIKRREEKILA